MHTTMGNDDWDFNAEIEKFWRERFADQLYFSTPAYMDAEEDIEMKWFIHGYKHALYLLRHGRDDLGIEDYDRGN